MRRLLSAGFYRLFRNRLFWGILIFMTAMAVIIPFVIYAQMMKYQLAGSVESVIGIHSAFTGFFTAVLCADFLGTEYSDGTVRNKLAAGHARWEIYCAGLAVCGAASILILLVHQVVISVIGRILISPFTAPLQMVLAFYGVSLLLGVTFAGIYTMLVKSNQNKAVAAVLCLITAILLFFISFYILARLSAPEMITGYEMTEAGEVVLTGEEPNPQYVGGALRTFFEFLTYFLPFGQMFHLSQADTGRLGIMALYDLLILAGTAAAGLAVFQRKDLK